jgi:endoglucanase
MQLVGSGKATALVSVPLRYMHSPVEVIQLSDLVQTVNLLTRFILDLKPGTSFTPLYRGAAGIPQNLSREEGSDS